MYGSWKPGAAEDPPSIAVVDTPGVGDLVEIGLESRAEQGEIQAEDGDPVCHRSRVPLIVGEQACLVHVNLDSGWCGSLFESGSRQSFQG